MRNGTGDLLGEINIELPKYDRKFIRPFYSDGYFWILFRRLHTYTYEIVPEDKIIYPEE